MNPDTLMRILEITYYISAIIGIPVAIVVFILEKRQERRNRDIDMYMQTAERYIQFLTLSLENPNLKVGDISDQDEIVKESGFTSQQLTMYQILISTLEQAFYLYNTNSLKSNEYFWKVWKEYIQWWVTKPDFRKAWKAIDPYCDPEFMKLIESELLKFDLATDSNVQDPSLRS